MSERGVLIIGGGLAGLFCALKLAPLKVTLLASAPLGLGASSAWAQGGIAAAISEGDSPASHTHDTMIAGAGIVDEAVTLGMAREAARSIEDLLSYGVPFDKDLEGKLILSREAAHSERRIVRVKGDTAGKAIMAALVAAVHATPSIELHEGYDAESLLMREGSVIGVAARHHSGLVHHFLGAETVLATGGIGHLFAVTTNPPQSRGLGLAMAARAGAVIADAEFVQFHPTAINCARDPAPLATEALRGDGATLVNRAGARFMLAVHKDAELAPRDIVARAVYEEIRGGRGAFLDARKAVGAHFPERFPTVYAACMEADIDPVSQPIPIIPAEHYHMGGVATDARGATSLSGLRAAGEVASTGVHGANRLASNSLLEAVVFAARIAAAVKEEGLGAMPRLAAADQPAAEPGAHSSDVALTASLRQHMSAQAGVIRDGAGLASAFVKVGEIERAAKSRLVRNMAVSALLVIASAQARQESRGGHYRSDFPQPDPAFAARSRITLAAVRKRQGA